MESHLSVKKVIAENKIFPTKKPCTVLCFLFFGFLDKGSVKNHHENSLSHTRTKKLRVETF